MPKKISHESGSGTTLYDRLANLRRWLASWSHGASRPNLRTWLRVDPLEDRTVPSLTLTAFLSADSVAAGSTVDVAGNASASGNMSSLVVTYDWQAVNFDNSDQPLTTDTQTFSSPTTSALILETHEYDQAGNYQVYVTATAHYADGTTDQATQTLDLAVGSGLGSSSGSGSGSMSGSGSGSDSGSGSGSGSGIGSDSGSGSGSMSGSGSGSAGSVANSSVASQVDGGSVNVGDAVAVTLTAVDAEGNPVPGLTGVSFGLTGDSTGTGTFGAVTDNGDGTYTAVFTAMSAGTVTFTASVGAVTDTDGQSVTIAAPVASSWLASSVDGGGVNVGDTVTVTLTAVDMYGNPVSGLTGASFGLTGDSTGTGTFGAVTDNGDGTYTAVFTAMSAGTVTFTASVGAATDTDGQSVTIAAGTGSGSGSSSGSGTISQTNSWLTSQADGGEVNVGDMVAVTLSAVDADENPVPGLAGVSFGLTGDSTGTGTFGAVTDNGDGTYTAVFTATSAGTVTFTASVGAATDTDEQSVSIAGNGSGSGSGSMSGSMSGSGSGSGSLSGSGSGSGSGMGSGSGSGSGSMSGSGSGSGSGSSSGSSSSSTDGYPAYVSAVQSAAEQYETAANSAAAQYYAAASAANSTAQTDANDAYALYQSTEANAYMAYNSSYSQAYNTLQSALDNANSTLAAAFGSIGNTLTTTLNSIVSVANAQFAADYQSLTAVMSSTGAQEQSDSLAAWNNGDIPGIDAIYNAYLTAIANAANTFNTSEVSAMSTAQSGVDSATANTTAALTAAEAAWTATVQPAYDTFMAANSSAWNTYLSTESSAWSQYQQSLANIATQQQSSLNAAANQYQTSMSTAAGTFSSQESSAWATYLQTLAPGQTPDPRLSNLPAVAPLNFVLAAPPAAQPEANRNQGKPPPIDWSKGKVLEENSTPWKGSGITGTTYQLQIGTDPKGKPIMITYWKAYAPWQIRFHYFCHGLTFSGGGPLSFSPDGESVPAILKKFYKEIPANKVQAGDILVGSKLGTVEHSAVIAKPAFLPNGNLDPSATIVNTKNGNAPETQMTVDKMVLLPAYRFCDSWVYYTRQ